MWADLSRVVRGASSVAADVTAIVGKSQTKRTRQLTKHAADIATKATNTVGGYVG